MSNFFLCPLLCLTFVFFVFPSSYSLAKNKRIIRVLTYNVWYGFTKEKARKTDWLSYVKSLNTDIVALQELNTYTKERLAEDARAFGHPYSVLLKESGFSTGITSRFPINDIKKVFSGYHHGMLSCKTGGMYVYVVHLHPGHWEIRHREIDILLKEVRRHKPKDSVLLVGDFNTFSHRDQNYYDKETDLIPFFKSLDERWKSNRNLRDEKLDFSHIERIEEANFVDLVAMKRKVFLGTFPTKLRLAEDNGPSRRLDYFFANETLSERCIKAEYLVNSLTDILSDHYPAIAEFN